MKAAVYFALIILVLGGLSKGHSQDVVVSDPISLITRGQYYILGPVSDRFIVYQEDGSEVSFSAFDTDMRFLWNKKVSKPERQGRTIAMSAYGERIRWYYTFSRNDSIIIDCRHFYLDATLDTSFTIFRTKDAGPNFLHEFSFDQQQLLFFQPTRNDELVALLYDQGQQEVQWHTILALEERFSRSFRAVKVSNAGEMFVVLEADNDRSDRKDHSFHIHYFRKGWDNTTQYKLPFYGYLTQSVTVDYDETNTKLDIAGYYTARNLNRTEGLFILDFQPTDTISHIVQFPWPDEVKQALYGPQGAGEIGIQNLVAKDLIVRDDGGLILMGEIQKVYERRSTFADPGIYSRGGSWVDFVYEDIIVSSIHPKGTMDWTKVLHKRQFSQDDNAIYSSFCMFVVPSFFRLIYNDEIGTNSTASSYELSLSGNASRTSILSTQFQKLQLRFQDAIQFSSTEILVPSEYKGELKLVKITF